VTTIAFSALAPRPACSPAKTPCRDIPKLVHPSTLHGPPRGPSPTSDAHSRATGRPQKRLPKNDKARRGQWAKPKGVSRLIGQRPLINKKHAEQLKAPGHATDPLKLAPADPLKPNNPIGPRTHWIMACWEARRHTWQTICLASTYTDARKVAPRPRNKIPHQAISTVRTAIKPRCQKWSHMASALRHMDSPVPENTRFTLCC
jgi:hypothetical protein